MLEGKEVQGKIGEYGEYFVDVNSQAQLEIGVSVKVDLLAEIEKLVKKTNTTMDDAAFEWVKKLVEAAKK